MNLDDELLKQLMKDSGVKEKTAAIHAAMRLFVQHAAALRLAKMGGTLKNVTAAPRRKSFQ